MMGAISVSVSGCVSGFAQARSQTSPSPTQVRGYSLEVRHLKFHKMIPSLLNFHYLRRRLMGGEPRPASDNRRTMVVPRVGIFPASYSEPPIGAKGSANKHLHAQSSRGVQIEAASASLLL